MSYTKKQMLAVLYGDDPDAEIVSDEITDNSRWSIGHVLIFKKDGKLWRTHYGVGATEQQMESAWEYCEPEIEEVEEYEKTIKAYRTINES